MLWQQHRAAALCWALPCCAERTTAQPLSKPLVDARTHACRAFLYPPLPSTALIQTFLQYGHARSSAHSPTPHPHPCRCFPPMAEAYKGGDLAAVQVKLTQQLVQTMARLKGGREKVGRAPGHTRALQPTHICASSCHQPARHSQLASLHGTVSPAWFEHICAAPRLRRYCCCPWDCAKPQLVSS
jgi:hypothetical protein